MGAIGAPEEYIVLLEDAGVVFSSPFFLNPMTAYPDDGGVLHEVPFSSLTYGRVTNNISTATVTVPNDEYGKTLCPYPLHGWDQAVAIYRNGLLVWRGFLMGWRRTSSGQVQLSARDVLAIGDRWMSLSDVVATDQELWSAVSDYIEAVGVTMHATLPMFIMDPLNMHPGGTSDISITKTFVGADARTLTSVFEELASEYNLFYSAGPDGVHYDKREFYFGTAAPVLNTHSVLNVPVVVVDCSGVAGMLFALSDNAGIGGYRTIEDASMTEQVGIDAYSTQFNLGEGVEPDPRAVGNELTIAVTRKAVETLVPKTTIEALKLATTFGSTDNFKSGADEFRGFRDFNDLRPGMVARWGFEEDCLSEVPITSPIDPTAKTGFYRTSRIVAVELVQLDVSVNRADDGLAEVISASFVPIADARFSSVEYPVVDGGGYSIASTDEVP